MGCDVSMRGQPGCCKAQRVRDLVAERARAREAAAAALAAPALPAEEEEEEAAAAVAEEEEEEEEEVDQPGCWWDDPLLDAPSGCTEGSVEQ